MNEYLKENLSLMNTCKFKKIDGRVTGTKGAADLNIN